MGSRKKKKVQETQKIAFLGWYKSLNINQRIAFKNFAYCEGRRRWTLQELMKPNTYFLGNRVPYSGACILLADAVQKGYTIKWQ